MRSPEHAEYEHLEERNSKIHIGMLLLVKAIPYVVFVICFAYKQGNARKAHQKKLNMGTQDVLDGGTGLHGGTRV